jgi:hypothetical protein
MNWYIWYTGFNSKPETKTAKSWMILVADSSQSLGYQSISHSRKQNIGRVQCNKSRSVRRRAREGLTHGTLGLMRCGKYPTHGLMRRRTYERNARTNASRRGTYARNARTNAMRKVSYARTDAKKDLRTER